MSQLYSVTPAATGVAINSLSPGTAILAAGYTSFVTVQQEKETVLYAFNKSTKLTDSYTVTAAAPYLAKQTTGSTAMNQFAWDSLKTFTLGNKQYLLSYESKSGTFGFFEVKADFTLSKPYTFMNQRSWPTQGFSEVSPFVSVGLVYILCYDDKKGTVAIFSLDVVASSKDGIPPLNMLNVWYHQWATAWECFSFFQLGQSNFFFKINKGKLNVNIDHVLDSPAQGSVEIGSYLQKQLPNAMDVSLACMIPWSDGEPYLATYDSKANNLNTYRIHADCQGWTNLVTTAVPVTSNMIAFRMEGVAYLLLY